MVLGASRFHPRRVLVSDSLQLITFGDVPTIDVCIETP